MGAWVTKVAAEKIEPMFSIFSAAVRFFQPQFNFFGCNFCHQFPLIAIAEPTNSRYCVFESPAIVMSKFSKMFDEDSILRIQGSCNDCDGVGG